MSLLLKNIVLCCLPFAVIVSWGVLGLSAPDGNAAPEDSSPGNAFYPNNRAPLLPTQYIKLPLGAVKPRGWLRDELVVEANGLAGHLPEVWDVVKTTSWKGDVGKNVGDTCEERFVPRWLEGVIPLAAELDDPHLRDLADPYMQYILNVQDLTVVTPRVPGWSHLGRVLPEYYEVTHDKRALELTKRIIAYADTDSVKTNTNEKGGTPIVMKARTGMLLSFSWWYYNLTGDTESLGKVDDFTRACVDSYRSLYTNFDQRKPNPALGLQGIDVTQSIQYPALYYLKAKDDTYKQCVYSGMASLDKYDGQVTGRWGADEWLAGTKPTQGSELCGLEELSYSLEKNIEALGDPLFADRLEKILFNSFPGTMTPDMWAHQYDGQANQVLVSVDKRPWHGNDQTSNIYGFTPNFPCCLANMHSPFPRYVEYMWMASNDNGLVAMAYGPSEVVAKVAQGATADLQEETDYPFGDTIQFKVKLDQPASFPLYLRVPSWADHAELTVPGEAQPRPLQPGTMAKIDRPWKSGDVINLALHNAVKTETRPDNSTSITWGPLYFVERIGEAFTPIQLDKKDYHRLTPARPLGCVNWRIDPTTDWNYGLTIDAKLPQATVVSHPIGQLPFAQKGEPVWLPGADHYQPWTGDVPLTLQVKAYKVAWDMNGANAADVPSSPAQAIGPETTIELVPYGCTRLRISEFPTVN